MALPAHQPSIDTCNACGKLFPRVTMRLCSACSLVPENRFEIVRDFVIEHDGANVMEIAESTGVSGSDVRKFLDGGRLVEVSIGNSCTCGGVGVGTRCRFCRSLLSSQLRGLEETMTRDMQSSPSPDERSGASYVRRIRRLNDQ
ncbi:MAG: flagellar protein [Thermoleophilia bacterium]|nr:flagellar protein [Thermoleophilia bacterium]MCZ4495861.1 flagellar protein [Thermoleophilia bacterium]